MTPKTIILCMAFAIMSLSAGECSALEDATDLRAGGNRCLAIEDRVSRLLCFDDLFGTPAPVVTIAPAAEAPAVAAPGPIRKQLQGIEASRQPDETGWLVRVRPWQSQMTLTEGAYKESLASRSSRQQTGQSDGGHETVDVFMTSREIPAADAQPGDAAILTLSCENDITTLGVLLSRPIRTLQAKLSLSGDRGSVFQLNWRDIENGEFVIAGRGLESIDTIKAIARFQRAQLQVSYPDGPRVFVFEISDLGERLSLLRTACHW